MELRDICFYQPDIGEVKLDNAVFDDKFVFIPYREKNYFFFLRFGSVQIEKGELLLDDSRVISLNGYGQLFAYTAKIGGGIFLSFVFYVRSQSEYKKIIKDVSGIVKNQPSNIEYPHERIANMVKEISLLSPLYYLVDMNYGDNQAYLYQIVDCLSMNAKGQVFILSKPCNFDSDETTKSGFDKFGKVMFSLPVFLFSAALVFLLMCVVFELLSIPPLLLLSSLFLFFVVFVLLLRVPLFQIKKIKTFAPRQSSPARFFTESIFGVGTGALFVYFAFGNELHGFTLAYFVLVCFLVLFSTMVGLTRINNISAERKINNPKRIKKAR